MPKNQYKDPKHAMNAETNRLERVGPPMTSDMAKREVELSNYKYGGGKMKAEPMYAKIGCKVYNNR